MARTSKPQVFLETSALVRFLTCDDTQKYQTVYDLLQSMEAGAIRPATSNIVWLELTYVLTRLYKKPQPEVYNALTQLRQMRGLVFIEKTDTAKALELWSKTKRPYGDCLIATQIPQKALVATFDADFKTLLPEQLYQWK